MCDIFDKIFVQHLDQLPIEEQHIAKRWVHELAGASEGKVIELLQMVYSGKITNEEAFKILDRKQH
jgi:hypothetical protein